MTCARCFQSIEIPLTLKMPFHDSIGNAHCRWTSGDVCGQKEGEVLKTWHSSQKHFSHSCFKIHVTIPSWAYGHPVIVLVGQREGDLLMSTRVGLVNFGFELSTKEERMNKAL